LEGGDSLNKKVLTAAVAMLAVAMAATSLLGTADACKGGRHMWWSKKAIVGYDFEATLGAPVYTYYDESGLPDIIIGESYRPAESVLECTVTINGKTYSYPEDFEYEELGYIEIYPLIGEAKLIVDTTFTFNMPGHPTLKEHLEAKLTNMGTPDAEIKGAFILEGTKMFHKVTGGGREDAHHEGVPPDLLMITSHVGLIKGWPL
jgi:hypothetical protein